MVYTHKEDFTEIVIKELKILQRTSSLYHYESFNESSERQNGVYIIFRIGFFRSLVKIGI